MTEAEIRRIAREEIADEVIRQLDARLSRDDVPGAGLSPGLRESVSRWIGEGIAAISKGETITLAPWPRPPAR